MATWDKDRVIEGVAAGLAGSFGDVRQIQENIEAMAERASGAPIVQPLQRVVFLQSSGNGSWTPPDEVSAFTVYLYSSGASTGATGGTATVTYDGVTMTCTGGISDGSAEGGTATGGDINLNGHEGQANGQTGTSGAVAPGPFAGGNVGQGAAAGGNGSGGSGACAIKRFAKTTGDVSFTFASAGLNNGAVIIEY